MWDDGGDLSRVIALPNPAAGAEVSYTFTGSEIARVRALTFKLVTNATAATRVVGVKIVGGDGTTIASCANTFTQSATETVTYTFGMYLSNTGANDAAQITAPLLPLWLVRGQKIETTIAAIVAGDQLSDVRLIVDQVHVPGDGQQYNQD